MEAGEESGRSGYILTFVITYIRDFVAKFRFVTESFETSVPWNKVSTLCENMIKTLKKSAVKHGIQEDRVFATNRVT